MLSNTCKYAIRAVIYLAMNKGNERKIGIKEISKDLEIPTPFLGKILQTLAKQKLLTSTKGPHGGFGIGKNVDEISLLDIVEIIDGLDVFTNCLIGMKQCSANGVVCPVHDQFHAIRTQLHEMFKNETIGKIIREMDSKVDFIKL
jgi:Rrf2 family protein